MFHAIDRKNKLSTQVAHELEQSILSEQFIADQPLPSEARLCTSFGVSRTVVREAIQQLKSQGIIHSIPGSGNYISKNSTTDLQRSLSLMTKLNEGTPLYHEILQLRELLEIECIEKVCHSHSDSLLIELKHQQQIMDQNFSNFTVFGKADHSFHLSIVRASENTLFHAILESLYDNFLKVSQKIYEVKGALNRICKEHAQIISAIEAKDSELAANLLKQHIQKTKDGI